MWFLKVLVLAAFCHVCIRAVKSYLWPEPMLTRKDYWIVQAIGVSIYFILAMTFLVVYGVI